MKSEKVKKPFYKRIWFWVFVVVIVAVGVAAGGGGDSSDEKKTVEATSTEKEDAQEEILQEEIVYEAYTADQMMSDLDGNALKAESTYNERYVEVTGRLGTIDSGGKYITLLPEQDEWAIVGIQCYIQTEEQKERVMQLQTGDSVTVRGQVTSVGEVLGYRLTIDGIN